MMRSKRLQEGVNKFWMRRATETMSVTFWFGLELGLSFAKAEPGGVGFSVPPFPIGATLLQKLTITIIQKAPENASPAV
jgi:hypothetical protein